MRSQEQKEADEALTAAIEACAAAYGVLDPQEMTQEYVVLLATQKWDGETETAKSSYAMLLRDGAVSVTRIVGLLEIASFDIKSGTP